MGQHFILFEVQINKYKQKIYEAMGTDDIVQTLVYRVG